ncbi:MAG: transcriptional regulator [Rhodovulum sp.]|jgi:hypothetical protein|nr:NepR family anti-sigma factor [Rhodovulum sp. FJ3]MAY31030.1 transcriptional regulator [Rhodovulum sp.]MCI5086311.1 transcriptional regulator [Rhodovulum sp.]MDV4169853.1 NepR family anti-sigma factor [Rhodovulum sp. FJ3]MEC8630382.1 NepR family anti-sigma factor [Pseudomonadota bacterium]|tara:strand:- start:3046 stop:3195 length:150 start_codon:yes stop_codon:yes gene_type:complete
MARKDKSLLEQQIDENLRRVFQKETEKEIPDRFTQLLNQLKEQEAQHEQ